ncbi:hypothetical protein Tco_0519195 [Tanacetum coccineum]
MPLDTDVDLDALGRSDECKGYSEAGLKRFMNAIEEEAAATSAEAGTYRPSNIHIYCLFCCSRYISGPLKRRRGSNELPFADVNYLHIMTLLLD